MCEVHKGECKHITKILGHYSRTQLLALRTEHHGQYRPNSTSDGRG